MYSSRRVVVLTSSCILQSPCLLFHVHVQYSFCTCLYSYRLRNVARKQSHWLCLKRLLATQSSIHVLYHSLTQRRRSQRSHNLLGDSIQCHQQLHYVPPISLAHFSWQNCRSTPFSPRLSRLRRVALFSTLFIILIIPAYRPITGKCDQQFIQTIEEAPWIGTTSPPPAPLLNPQSFHFSSYGLSCPRHIIVCDASYLAQELSFTGSSAHYALAHRQCHVDVLHPKPVGPVFRNCFVLCHVFHIFFFCNLMHLHNVLTCLSIANYHIRLCLYL